ncbi:site-specific integrase, partial [Rhodococcus sp. H29-C3]|nr:site-specific integrase [Rhodococcus sp. H29-C3]
MVSAADLPGASHLVLAPGVAHLDPKTAVFEAMLDGWARQQRARFLKPETIAGRELKIRRMTEFTNDYPWSWRCADVEEFIDTRRHCGRRITVATARLYEHTLRTFLEFVT